MTKKEFWDRCKVKNNFYHCGLCECKINDHCIKVMTNEADGDFFVICKECFMYNNKISCYDDKEKIRDWILDHFVNNNGSLDLSGLDFSNFDGNIYINNWKVKFNLSQSNHEVGGDLEQGFQKVKGDLYQDNQVVEYMLIQNGQIAYKIHQDIIIDDKNYNQALKELKEKYKIEE